jgi:hypothetical protein
VIPVEHSLQAAKQCIAAQHTQTQHVSLFTLVLLIESTFTQHKLQHSVVTTLAVRKNSSVAAHCGTPCYIHLQIKDGLLFSNSVQQPADAASTALLL